MRLLDWAIDREDWETAALCILFKAVKEAEGMEDQAIDALIDEMARPVLERRRRHGRRDERRREQH